MASEPVTLDRKSLSEPQIQILEQATNNTEGYETCLDTEQPAFEDLIVVIFLGGEKGQTIDREELQRASFSPFEPVVWQEAQFIAFYRVTHRN